MSRIIHLMLALVILVGIAGCSNADKPAAEGDTPTPDPVEHEKQLENMRKYHDQSQSPDSSQ